MSAKSPEAKAKLKANQKAYSESPRGKWSQQKAQAKARGIPFDLTFEEWWEVWSLSGHYHLRGKSASSYCMSRVGDVGPYSSGNVVIKLVSDNISEQLSSGAHKFVCTTKSDIDGMRALAESGVLQTTIGAKYGVHQSEVSRLLSGARGAYLS